MHFPSIFTEITLSLLTTKFLQYQATTLHNEERFPVRRHELRIDQRPQIHTSFMNRTVNNATSVSPHYTFTGSDSNIGLPKLSRQEVTNDHPGCYGKQKNPTKLKSPCRLEANHKL